MEANAVEPAEDREDAQDAAEGHETERRDAGNDASNGDRSL